MRVVIAASGTADDPREVADLIDRADLCIAADGGARHVWRAGRRPDLIVGDLDSIPADLLAAARAEAIDIDAHATAKDETDLELALQAAVDRGATAVTVVGLHGGRTDHELANVALIAACRWHEAGMAVEAHDGTRSLWVVHDEVELTLDVGVTLSLLPWGGAAHGVTSNGVRWPLRDADLPSGTPRGMSNVATERRQRVTVDEGVLLVIVDRSEA